MTKSLEVLLAIFPLAVGAMAHDGATVNAPIPQELSVPSGHVLFLTTHASGTQNYICVPGATGPTWKFVGPQATVFVNLPWPGRSIRHQIATHHLGANPAEGGTHRPSWQHSVDTSSVWAKPVASFSGPPVAPGAVPWLLLEVVGSQAGPTGGSALRATTYIQRLNTSGGVAPADGCNTATYGTLALVPYLTDYLFYGPATK